MAKKKNELVIKEKLENENIDLEKIKEELTDYVDLKIKKEMNEEIEKANKRVLREKNKKIMFRNVVIIILFLIIIFLLYLLNSVGYFAKFVNKEKMEENEIVEKQEEKSDDNKKEEIVKPTLEELKAKYANLLDYYYVNENSKYLNDFYGGNLSLELKKYMALNEVNFNLLSKEDDYNVIDNTVLKEAWKRIFNDEYQNGTFDYNGNKVRYINSLDAYLTEKILEKEKRNIKKDIINIEEDGEKVIISTVEGLVIDNKLYNINKEEIKDNKNVKLTDYQDKLNKVRYTFKDGKLISLNKFNFFIEKFARIKNL